MATPLARLTSQLDELHRLASMPDPDLCASGRCSGWTPAEHLDHMLKVTKSIVRRLLDLEAPPSSGITATGRLILLLGRIPRGRGKSPERLRGTKVSQVQLRESLKALEADIQRLEDAHLSPKRGAVVPHPRFGGLTPSQAIRFAVIHNRHHFLIIKDVMRQRG
jgi:hypothetical protein